MKIPQDRAYFESDTTIWSGSLYNLEATKQVGLPRFGPGGFWEDFGLDMGDPEYGYRIKRAGYTVLVHRGSIIDHRIGHITKTTLFGRTFVTSHHPAFRRYLSFRNLVYFWLYIHPDRKLLPVLLFLLSRLVKEIIRIAVLEKNARVKICACTIGAWDGIRKNLHCNYDR